jgi:uncharacterized membrane protein YcjF (UPF0283 family)
MKAVNKGMIWTAIFAISWSIQWVLEGTKHESVRAAAAIVGVLSVTFAWIAMVRGWKNMIKNNKNKEDKK